jgi:type VI secretion system secreted protein VgrG
VTYTSGAIAGDFLFEWERGYNFFTGQWTQTDYNYLTPTANMSSTTTTVQPLSMAKQYEFYDYPGGYTAKANGQSLTQIRMEAEELTYNEVKGAGTYSSFCPAGTFTVSSHDNSAEVGQSCVLTAVRHQAHEVGYLQCDQGRESFYQNRFTCIPASSTFRPARLTPQPVVRGPETALVVGPSGEEIYVNQYGCIKIQMFWDRVGQKNENSSCWVRLAQGWSGSGWGMQFLPRIGQEVVVEFLDGDPDSPIVTGCVHNAQNLPPFTLNTNMTQSGIKTRSTKGGNASTFNQLLFEDKNGSEAIIIQAQKDLNCTVNNNDTLVVSGDQSVTITNNRTTVLNKGNDSTTIQAGTSSLTAAKQITFSVGGNSITIDSSGITIKGMNITLQGQTQVQVQAPSINATADTALQLKGAIVNIN